MKKIFLAAVLLVAVAGLSIVGYRHFFPAPDRTDITNSDFPVVFRTKGGLLEVATLVHPQQFSNVEYRHILGWQVDLCPTTASIGAKAYFTYRIKLAPEWKARITADKRVVLVVPELEPALPVAIDTKTLQDSINGCPFFKDPEALQRLRERLSADLAAEAVLPDYKRQVRADATKTVQEFIRKWCLSRPEFAYAKDYQIVVYFKGDPIEDLM